MRGIVDARRLAELLQSFGRVTSEPTTVYLVGGATAVLHGWRETTIDVDLYVEPERDSLLRALPDLKERLQMNIEFASPLDFLPELPEWRERSPFVAQERSITARHFDLSAQALSKLERGFDQDLVDVRAMVRLGLVDPTVLSRLFDAIEPQLYRYPTVDAAALGDAVRQLGTRERPSDR